MAAAPKRTARLGNYQKRGFEFGTGGMPMAPMPGPAAPPPPADPGQMVQQQMAAVPPKDKGKIKKLLGMQLKKAMKQKKAGPAMPMPPAAPAPAPAAPMKCGGKVKKAIGGAVRGIGIARKGGGRGKMV